MSVSFGRIRSKLLCNLKRTTGVPAQCTTRSFSRLMGPSRLIVPSMNHANVNLWGNPALSPMGLSLRHFSSKQELSDLLAKELKEEVDNGNTEMPQELLDLKATVEENWRIVEEGAMTRLYSTAGASKVTVSFHCQDSVDDPVEEEGYEEEQEYAVPFRFVVTCTKAGKTQVFNCMSAEGAATVESVAITTDDIDTIHSNGGISSKQYQGPDFHELDEGVQEAFHVYLQDELGVNEDVAAFVAMYADYKEETQYVQFLKDSISLIS